MLYESAKIPGCEIPSTFEEILFNGGIYEIIETKEEKVYIHAHVQISGIQYHSILGTGRVETTVEDAMARENERESCVFGKVK
jgi:hypothetical protein